MHPILRSLNKGRVREKQHIPLSGTSLDSLCYPQDHLALKPTFSSSPKVLAGAKLCLFFTRPLAALVLRDSTSKPGIKKDTGDILR